MKTNSVHVTVDGPDYNQESVRKVAQHLFDKFAAEETKFDVESLCLLTELLAECGADCSSDRYEEARIREIK